jgi:hypothetical protein
VFGPTVIEEEIHLENPLIIQTRQEWLLDLLPGNSRDLIRTPHTDDDYAELLTNVKLAMEAGGHDGMIVQFTEDGDVDVNNASIKKLRQLVGTVQLYIPDTLQSPWSQPTDLEELLGQEFADQGNIVADAIDAAVANGDVKAWPEKDGSTTFEAVTEEGDKAIDAQRGLVRVIEGDGARACRA